MPTEVIKTIKPAGGGDYLSFEAFDIGERRNVATGDQIAVAECYPGGNLIATPTARLIMDTDWFTTVTNYVEIRAAPGFHITGAPYDTVNFPFAEWNIATSLFGLRIGIEFFRLKGIQLRSRGGAGRILQTFKDMPNAHIRIEECLFVSDGTEVAQFPVGIHLRPVNLSSGVCGGTNGRARVYNNIIFFDSPPGTSEGVGNGFLSQGDLTEVDFINNTIIIPSSTPGAGSCLAHTQGATGGILNSQNGYYKATGTAVVYGGTTVSGTNDATSTAEASDPELDNIAYDSSNFVNPTAAHTTFDVALLDGSALIDKGADVSSFAVTTDVAGSPRVGFFDIGAHELQEVIAALVGSGREPLVVVELEQDQCRLIYAESPCEAALGTTGTRKCYNTRSTCQDRDNYDTRPDVVDTVAVSQDIENAGAQEASFDVSTQEPIPTGVQFKSDGTKLYIIGQDQDQVRQYPVSTPWDISTAGSVEASFSVAGEDTAPQGLFFKSDGTKLYIVGDDVNQYPLSTAWDISTAGLVEATFSVATEDTNPQDLFFKADGTKLYVAGGILETVYQYTLWSAWDISSAGAVEASFNVSGEETDFHGMSFTRQGTKLYVIGTNSDRIHQYPLSTAWDISTAGAVESSFSVQSEEEFSGAVTFKSDETKVYICGISGFVRQYPIAGTAAALARDATRADVEKAGVVESSFDVSGEETEPHGVFFKSDGTKLYVVGVISDKVHQYPLSTAWDVSTTGAVEASFDVSGEEGAPRELFFKHDGTKLYVSGLGSASVHQYRLATPWAVSSAAFEASFSVSAQETIPSGLHFKSDGTKLYISGQVSSKVHQYPLSTAWDISSAGAVEAALSTTTEDANPNGLFFRADGAKLYVVGRIGGEIHQYPLPDVWDISTAGAVESSFDVTGEDAAPEGVFFKPDIRKMYMVGSVSDDVHQYPFALREGVINGAVHVSSSPTGFGQAISFDGVNDSVEVTDAVGDYEFSGTAAFTIEFLVDPSSIPNSLAALFYKQFTNGLGEQGWRIRLRLSDTSLVFERLRDGVSDLVAASVTLGAARFWSAVYDGTDLILYEEGTERSRTASAKVLLTNVSPFFIGNMFVGETVEAYHGLLDEIRIWSTARSEAEIRARMVLPLSGLEQGLVSYFPFDDDPPGVATRTLRFTKPQTTAPRDLYLLPLLADVETASTRLNPGGGSRDRGVLGDRASVQIGFKDAPSSDRVVDKYRAERISGTAQTDEGGYEPLDRGSFWAKWRARNLFFQNRRVRILEGYVGEELRDMQVREYFIDQLRGPDAGGRTMIRAKDVLKLADDERAQAPPATPGELSAALTVAETTSFQATGALIADYPDAPGLVRIGDEVIEYTTRTQATVDNVQFNTLTRASRGSEAAAHDADDRVQRCLEFVNVLPWKLAEDLLVNFGNVPSEFIPIVDWDAEGEVWLSQFTLSAVITEPTSVTKLLSEITQEAQFFIWWAEHSQTIKLKALRPPVETPVELDEDSHLIEGASVLKEHPDQRLSQVWIFFSQKDPTKRLAEEANFSRVRIRADLEAETAAQYGETRIQKIFSRWIESESHVSQITKRTLDRFRDNPRSLKVRVDAKDRASLRVGEIVDIVMRTIVDDRGLQPSTRWQIISAREEPAGEAVALELLESEFTGRFAFYMETAAPTFASATDEEKKSGAWYSDEEGQFPDGTDGYQYQ